ncbi:hypothetical protein BGZ61DRAFT_450084 [Ilyonectria robusta]|uniref:uncharacterized protein n=1 Tax=Ilyonectria robusta TaxID=1079257 RepID=UPI001E8CD5DA|nr:uncharacterized protein BGZ61DRAFT_450084 [Ilyonectria robusta]KAH6983072.1 hypothetical protein BKA56DRAFT_482758 [Ilyonectria sp. MPI-CAGE-AT-0026]KAH8706544.1 hypothetical protein BGZ61DRAFT_450084 [Ilyonectria robusta]
MFPTLFRRMAASAKGPLLRRAPLSVVNNPYKARKVWPPNFKELTVQQQLRFEKKYKRRIMLASRSPRWEKGVKLAQLITIVAALVWILFYSEFEWWGQKYKPSEEIRRKTNYLFGVLDPEKRYERRKDAPPPPPPKDEEESK